MKRFISLVMCLTLCFLSSAHWALAGDADAIITVALSGDKGAYTARVPPGLTAKQAGDMLSIYPEGGDASARPPTLLTITLHDGGETSPEEWRYIHVFTFNGDYENDIKADQFKLKDGSDAYGVRKVWHLDEGGTSVSMDCWYDIPGMQLYAQYELPAAYTIHMRKCS